MKFFRSDSSLTKREQIVYNIFNALGLVFLLFFLFDPNRMKVPHLANYLGIGILYTVFHWGYSKVEEVLKEIEKSRKENEQSRKNFEGLRKEIEELKGRLKN